MSKQNTLKAPCTKLKTKSGKTITSIIGLYSLLLESGWQKNTCVNQSSWTEANPVVGQSLATALLVQKCFGGDVLYFKYSNRTHHFNYIHGCYVDLTFDELDPNLRENYPPRSSINLGTNPHNTYEKNFDKLKTLIENCGLIRMKLTPPRRKYQKLS